MSHTLVGHADGASRGNPGPAGVGAVVIDASGRERRVVSLFLGVVTNNVAEYLALHETLKAAAEVCAEDGLDPAATSLTVYTDSQLMAKQISGEYRVKSPDLAPLVQTYRRLTRPFLRVEVRYVPREKNRRADALANQAIDAATGGGPSSPAPGRGSGSEAVRAAPAPYSRLSHLECSECGGHQDPAEVHNSCPACRAPLLARYDLNGFSWPPEPPREGMGPQGDLFNDAGAGDGARNAGCGLERDSMWRYHELLPATSARHVISLGEGLTPLVPLAGQEFGLGRVRVLVKDEGLNPTATFKARGASAAVSRLVELGVRRCAIPTAGNAGSAFAAYCARAGVEFLAAMPEDTPEAIRLECESYGGTVETVPGLLPDAARHLRERPGDVWYTVATFDEPYRLEGKKTIGFELFEAFGGRWPDAIACPVGGGVALVAIWKAVSELAAAGVASRVPRLFAVQAEGCSPVVRAFAEGAETTRPFEGARTVAVGLRVPAPKAGSLILKALRGSGGGAVAVGDADILGAAARLRRLEGLDVCPEGAAAVAALPDIVRRGWLEGCGEVVVVNTGSGLKYPR